MFEYDKEVLETKVALKKLMSKNYEQFIVALMLVENGEGGLTIDDAVERYETWIENSGWSCLLNEVLSGEIEIDKETDGE